MCKAYKRKMFLGLALLTISAAGFGLGLGKVISCAAHTAERRDYDLANSRWIECQQANGKLNAKVRKLERQVVDLETLLSLANQH